MTRVPGGTVRTGAPLPGTGAGMGLWAAARHAGDHRLPAVTTTPPPTSVAMRRHALPLVFTTARLPRTGGQRRCPLDGRATLQSAACLFASADTSADDRP